MMLNALNKGCKFIPLILLSVLILSRPAAADQLFVCQAPCSTPPGGDPNIITSPSSLDIGIAGAGHMDQSATLLFVGFYVGNGSTPALMVMVGSTMYMPGGVGDWGET